MSGIIREVRIIFDRIRYYVHAVLPCWGFKFYVLDTANFEGEKDRDTFSPSARMARILVT
jgi:hypothetical protein